MSETCEACVCDQKLPQDTIYSNSEIDSVKISPTGQLITIYLKNGKLVSFESKLVVCQTSISSKIVSSSGSWGWVSSNTEGSNAAGSKTEV